MSEKPTTTPNSMTQAADPEEERRRIHELADRLPESELSKAAMILRAIVEDDGFLWKHATAPEEDETLSAEEWAKIQEGLEDAERGDLHRLEDVERDFRR